MGGGELSYKIHIHFYKYSYIGNFFFLIKCLVFVGLLLKIHLLIYQLEKKSSSKRIIACSEISKSNHKFIIFNVQGESGVLKFLENSKWTLNAYIVDQREAHNMKLSIKEKNLLAPLISVCVYIYTHTHTHTFYCLCALAVCVCSFVNKFPRLPFFHLFTSWKSMWRQNWFRHVDWKKIM